MKPLVIGAKGFVGRHFYRYFRTLFPDLIGTHHSQADDLHILDLENPAFDFSLSGYRYALITGGIANLRICEENPEKSYRCNVEGPIKLGKELLKRKIIPVFFSTDYVFDGTEEIYKADTPTSPLNEYGRQKAELENQALELESIVIRLSKVYGVEKGDGTLFDEMASRLQQKRPIRAARDQVFAPISIEDVVKGVSFLMHLQVRGIINVASRVCASRLQMAEKVAQKLDVEKCLVEEIELTELNDSFQRPKRINLQSTIPAISWEEGIEKIVSQYAEK